MAKCSILQVILPLGSFVSSSKGDEGNTGIKERKRGGK
jgi:hypothetical protein